MNTKISLQLRTIVAAAVITFTGIASAGVTTRTVSFFSQALDRPTTYIAAVPSPRIPDHNYPVVYLLHGATGDYRDWTSKTTVTELLDGRDMILIMPDGGPYGWYLDSKIKPDSQYETAIIRDLLRDVEARFPVARNRDGRGIAGLSMGGHGALYLAAKHPELFSSASSMSGILNVSVHPGSWGLNDILGTQTESADALPEWKRHSVLHLADRFATADMALLFDTGVSDKTGAVEDNRRTHEALSNRSIYHTYHEYPGVHNWDYWSAHIGEHLDFHEDNFTTRSAGNKPLTGLAPDEPPGYTTKTLSYEKENRDKWASNNSRTSPVIVLLGSSTFSRTSADLFPNYAVANRGIGGDRLGIHGNRGLLDRLYCSVFDVKPAAILINNGTNDLYRTSKEGSPSVEEAGEGFKQVVSRIRQELPDTPILIVSCHSTRGRSGHIASFIPPYNAITKELVGQVNDVYYVDTYAATVGDDGLLNPKYTRDGLHFNPAGYAILGRLCNQALEKAGVLDKD